MTIIDTHSHLDEFLNHELIIKKAKEFKVIAIIAVGVEHESNLKLITLSNLYERYVFPAFGIHPWEAKIGYEKEIESIEERINDCIAIGEIGLDYWIKIDKIIQKQVFEKLLGIAKLHKKPICVHSRGAWEDTFSFVKKAGIEKAVFHWYSGPITILEQIIDSGYYISATPASEYSKNHIEAIKKVPLENLVLETDSPVKYRGRPSEPSDVSIVAKQVSRIKGVSEEEVSNQTVKNSYDLFNLKNFI